MLERDSMESQCGRSSLVDRFGRSHTYLRVSVTDRCNFRCIYCMPKKGAQLSPRSEILTFDEIERVVRLFSQVGISKVRFTGGEPLVRKNVTELIANVRRIQTIETIGVTTNGVLLNQYAAALKEAGVDLLNVSLDSLDEKRFQFLSGSQNLKDVLAGIHAALKIGFKQVKLNVVIIKEVNEEELCGFIDYFHGYPIELRFIEYMPFLKQKWDESHLVPWTIMRDRIQKQYDLAPMESAHPVSVAKLFQIQGSELRVGFISTMSEHYCNDCNRLRLMADGSIKSCLFKTPESNIRDLLRSRASDREIQALIASVVETKTLARPPIDPASPNSPMVKIGG
ncbi:MAG: GTP 3',8-cyclase MoaA [Candidatus Hinthialibacter antarcticus]|nr:GTP 3',8-cyclase MoaA [Candidatus Hinthialibacter antarcticus]